MNKLSIKIGYWSSLISIILVIIWSVGGAMAFSHPFPDWTNPADFISHIHPISLIGYTIGQITAFLMGPIYLVMFCSLHDYAKDEKKILTRIGIGFVVATLVLGNQMYFVHFNSLRLILNGTVTPELEQFFTCNPNSFITQSGAALGWGFFAGLAALSVAFIFNGSRLERSMKIIYIALGIDSLIGMTGIFLGNMVILKLYMAGSISGLLMSISTFLLFRRFYKTLKLN